MEGDGTALMGFRNRFDELKASDSQRQSLVQELIDQNDKLLHECQRMNLDLESERNERRRLQKRISEELEPLNNGRSFVLVLIDADGDGYIFRDVYLNKGEDGGRRAADELLGQIKKYLKELGLQAGSTDVVVRAYANIHGLGRACVKSGGMEATTNLHQFASGFTGRQPLFDFVDVGDGKEKADQKIKDVFSFHIASSRCKHVLLGISHDSGYVPFLSGFAGDVSFRDRITLLHGYQVSPAIQTLGFPRTVNFTSVFAPAPVVALQTKMPQPQAATPKQSSRAAKGSFTSPNVDSTKLKPIMTNESGHRIDKPLQVDPSLQQAMARKNLCVWLFLKGHCSGCVRNHSHRPLSEEEYDALWLVARQGQCFNHRRGKICLDPTCVYGHGR
ncbi:MAG: hypothetical protein Q9202_002285 [Teloschistes flavicans]